jgi:hypothetical protein
LGKNARILVPVAVATAQARELVLEDGGDRLLVRGAKEEGAVVEGLRCQVAQHLGLHLQEGVLAELLHRHPLVAEEAVAGLILRELEGLLELELAHAATVGREEEVAALIAASRASA